MGGLADLPGGEARRAQAITQAITQARSGNTSSITRFSCPF
jgi:hypothetical protein